MAIFVPLKQRGVEQLVARRAHNPKVVGSSPAPATKRKNPLTREGFLFYIVNSEEIVFRLKNEATKS